MSVIARCERITMKKIKAHSLTGRITPKLMEQAFRKVKRNRGAAGVDKVSIQMFEANLKENLDALMRELKGRTFKPRPLRRVYIQKAPQTKKFRALGIPVVRDRVAQEVLRKLLAPIFEPLFHNDSYGFITNRNCHMAIQRAIQFHNEEMTFILDFDIQKFFDNIPHKIIMKEVAVEVADGNILNLIEAFLAAGVMEDGVYKPTNVGTPQGGVLSPLLANIVLNRLDWKLHEKGYQFVRYADDAIVVGHSKMQVQEALILVEKVLKNELRLTLNEEKTKISTYGKGYEFLGFFISSRSKRMRDKSVRKFKDKIRELTIRHHNMELKVIEKLNQVIRGTANYFAPEFSTNRWLFQKLDSWVRMRLRCMKYKRKNYNDNRKLRARTLSRKFGLLCLEQFCWCKDRNGKTCRVIPRCGATSIGVAR